MDIQHKHLEACQVATAKFVVQRRTDIGPILAQLAQELPEEAIAGAPFAIFQFVTSITDGYDAEIGFPVNREVTTPTLRTRILPAMEVLSLVHPDEAEKLRETYGKLYAYAAEHAIISDEFGREVYADASNPGGPGTEAQYIIHDWNGKLAHGLERVLGQDARAVVMQDSETLSIASRVEERFLWVKAMLERLDGLADEHQKYDILSGCAHVFPPGQVAKLKVVFNEAYAQTQDGLQAVDAVLDFMKADPGWGETRPTRKGYTIYAAKSPRDPKAYAEAKTDLERRRAYCFCPLLRDNLDQGMPTAFCYCGSGWYRRQFEGAIGKPVTIDIVTSVLQGDDECQFAIHLPEDL
jgi:effector-binding domain-containing protein